MDDNPGTDYLLVLYSKKKLDANELWNAMNAGKGSLSARIKNALGNELIPASEINYNADRIGFQLKPGARGNVAPVMVAITHQ